MKIVFTKNFDKLLLKLKIISQNEIISLIKKYPNTKDLIIIDNLEVAKVLKWYLSWKKIRLLVLFQYIKWKFIPISIVKKETFKWQNITKENYIKLFWNDIDKSISDIDNNNYTEVIF